MHVHRSRHTSGFTILPNLLLQDRRLSYTARGLLADLLSRPEGWREDGRQMADSSSQGRTAVRKALRELTDAGYYRVVKVRRADGTFLSEIHVYDTPQTGEQVPPAAVGPVSGGAAVDLAGVNPVKDLGKEPSLPAPSPEAAPPHSGGPTAEGEGGRAGADPTTDRQARGPADEATSPDLPEPVAAAAEALLRVVRSEPRLRLGSIEALALAPKVAVWLERGFGERDLAQALLTGLPDRVHSASALLGERLVRKLPPVPALVPASGPAVPPLTECPTCGVPLRHAGICRACAGLGTRTVAVGGGEAVARRGAARVRAALQPAARHLTPSRA
ncbi:hypothetical protein [Streptacidiphilus carbonis]|uniref:hypothetical protein n=1 Tax=Streptacidiphilus carbonis TaxID=105422 RepID=UPI000694807F|nr:hypothetical protein [Streptacidiphilus carbonis]